MTLKQNNKTLFSISLKFKNKIMPFEHGTPRSWHSTKYIHLVPLYDH